MTETPVFVEGDSAKLLFEPDPPVKGHVNLADVKKIRLLEVVDYHGE